MISRRTIALAVVALLALFVFSWWREHRPAPSEAQQIAHQVTAAAVEKEARVETLYVAEKAASVSARASVRTFRDTLRITDTLEVKRFVARVDTALVKDSLAIAAADTVIAAGHAVEAGLRTELALALRPRPAKRLSLVLTGLYDPITHTPLASASAGLRIIGSVSLVGVAFQKVQLGETPRVFFGLSVRL